MKFKANSRRRALEYEKDILKFWKENRIFEKSVENRPVDNRFVFYDGPPFLTGSPHHGHLLVSTVKDAIGRFQTMKGKRVERTWGWDCHGLPAEVFVEKELGIKNKKEIGEKISIPDYVAACRAAMVKTSTEWEDTIDRLGRWVEFEGAYKTMDKEYMESVWWAFKTLYDKGKIYEGEKILVYCTKDATPISKSEVAMENSYQTVTDPSVYVKFKIVGEPNKYLLAWTTTPWTLPANVALAVSPEMDYVEVEYNGEILIMAKSLVEKVMTDEKHQPLDYKIVGELKGKDLVGLKYEPLFDDRGKNAHQVYVADYVSDVDGTGIVHTAPAYGEDDFSLAEQYDLPVKSMVDADGNYTEGRWVGKNIWEVNKEIAKTLLAEGKALKIDYIRHEYPHCHRCGTKLMYRAHPSWFMDIDSQRKEMLEANTKTRWVPDNLRTGRFHNIIEQAPDWNLSRDRYWATPIPVWKGKKADGSSVVKVIGSYDEFEELTGLRLDDYHLPQVMDVTFEYEGATMRHIGKVLDCWFESGSMPFAQFHYPFENKKKFEESFPADFITEAIDQTRGWFYSLTAVNVGLFGKAPWKNLICTGFMNAADGKKMSKKLKNYTDPMELMDKFSADSFRFLMLSSPLTNGENFSLADKMVGDVARKLGMIWNMYDFFTMYAEVDGWEFDPEKPLLKLNDLTNKLDIWIVSRLHELNEQIVENMDKYNLSNAMSGVLPFIDDASNWYVRRSRRRFWRESTIASSGGGKAGDDDKSDAYKTLHYVLLKLSVILAPFTPFLAEELYKKMGGSAESVHLLDYPMNFEKDKEILEDMSVTQTIVMRGLSQRMDNNDEIGSVKVRQPLNLARYNLRRKLNKFYEQIIGEELNVKCVERYYNPQDPTFGVEIDKRITPILRREGLAREVIRAVQNARKKAGLNVDDRINLQLLTDDENLKQAISQFKDEIHHETLTISESVSSDAYSELVQIDKIDLTIRLEKA